MRTKAQPINHQRAGQFLFVRFPSDKILNESHPFTISSAPKDEALRVTIKASGDFTRELFTRLKEGAEAVVDGAYGMFDYKTGGQKQIWVAGGIGVTPFLSFIRDMDGNLAHDVDFYYTVRHPDEALFVDEIQAAAQKNPRLKFHILFNNPGIFIGGGNFERCSWVSNRSSHLHLWSPANDSGLRAKISCLWSSSKEHPLRRIQFPLELVGRGNHGD
jgi:predicted ferric reductase